MAKAELTVDVSVEPCIHEALRKFVEHVHVEHGLQIKSMRVSWITTGQLVAPSAVIGAVEVTMES